MTSDDRKRYRGHLSLCEIDLPGQQRIAQGRVLIVGAGGLGSPVALYLAAAGVGHIAVLDPDLGRHKALSARDAMTRINPTVTVEPLTDSLTPGNARDIIDRYDLVIDCTDNLDTRLLINDTCEATGKSYVFGAVRRFEGQVFTHTPGTASYRDIFGSEPSEGGDIPCAVDGVMNTVVGVIGCLQATEAIKWLAHTGDLLTDRLLTFDAITMTFNTFRLG